MEHAVSEDKKEETLKKSPLENLSKEELIKKCKNILIIAQKAKHSRDELYVENEKIQKEYEAAKEMIDSLMEQKVSLTLRIDNIEKNNKRIDELEIENESYKRQTRRLTDENEELLKQLDLLERKSSEFSNIVIDQSPIPSETSSANTFIEREDSGFAVSLSENIPEHYSKKMQDNSAELSELQTMLSRSLDEIKILRTEKDKLNEVILNYKSNSCEKSVLNIQSPVIISENTISNNDTQYLEKTDKENLSLEVNKLKTDLMTKEKEIEFVYHTISKIVDELHNTKILFYDLLDDYNEEKLKNIKYKQKIQNYHTKLIKFVSDIKELKTCKNYLLTTMKQYSENMDKWQFEMKTIALKMTEYIQKSENEKDQKISELITKCNELHEYNSILEKEKKLLTSQTKNEMNNVNEKYFDVNMSNLHDKLTIKDNKIIELEATCEKLKNTYEETENTKSDNRLLRDTNDNLKMEIEEMSQSLKLHKSSSEFQIEMLKDSNKNLTSRITELQQYIDKQYEKYENEHEILKSENVSLVQIVEEMKLENQQKYFKENFNTAIQNKGELLKKDQCESTSDTPDFQSDYIDKKQIIEHLQHQDSKNTSTINDLQNELDIWKNNYSQEQDKIREFEKEKVRLEENIDYLNTTINTNLSNYEMETTKLKNENKTLCIKISDLEQKIQQQEFLNKEQVNVLQENNNKLLEEIQSHKSQNDNQLLELQEKYSENCEIINELNQKLEQQAFIESELMELKQKNVELSNSLENQRSVLEEMHLNEETNRTMLRKKQEEINEMENNITELHTELESQNISYHKLIEDRNKVLKECESLQEEKSILNTQLVGLKQENAELLSEMNEMIQELKQRGEKLSKLQEINSELQKKGNDISDENQNNYKEQLLHKETLIQKLETDIEALKEKLNNLDYQNDSMSTSTISRADEANRLLELEGTWEERYGKLKQLAIRLKKRGSDLNEKLSQAESEKNELKEQICNKNEEIETIQKEFKKAMNTLKSQNQLTSPTIEIMQPLPAQVNETEKSQILFKEDLNYVNAVQELQSKIDTLKKEVEAEKLSKQELEQKILTYEMEINLSEKSLKDEIAKHKSTKEQLMKLSKESKKKSVLNLEMDDYERSLKDMSKKLETKQVQICSLESTIDTQLSTIAALREQIRDLDNTIASEQENSKQLKDQFNETLLRLNEMEELHLQKDLQINNLEVSLENAKAHNEDINFQLAKLISEHKKTIDSYINEKEQLKGVVFDLEEKLRSLTTCLQMSEQEVSGLKSQFEGYKVRAVSVLKQSKSNGGVGLDAQQLSEEITELKAQIDTLKIKLDSTSSELQILTEENTTLVEDKINLEEQSQELVSMIDTLQKKYDSLLQDHTKKISENNEAIRAQKIRNDTLSQCYRQQINELEEKYGKEIMELREKLEEKNIELLVTPQKPSQTLSTRLGNLEEKLDITSMEREEGEGSESVDSTSYQQMNQTPIPLDQLLFKGDIHSDVTIPNKIISQTRPASPMTELRLTKQQLLQCETRVAHLTGLLSDAELDLAKLSQLNQVLKEEIRRHQRSVEREQHAENLEYLKNVIFKFITLGNCDEKTHLVPVLTTILKLSPDETQKLNSVAKGLEASNRSWGSYLPLPKWPGV